MFDPAEFNDIHDLIDLERLRQLVECTFSSGIESGPVSHLHFLNFFMI
ncbi:hypothetical protein D1BOALGB6SA_2889 [Olavius sp. associated proteobacterium Delta 1]|nr:hypothetical protein D1BOALGB6SA_2889 [Olavius sp. associated proteobacterium Delta 1]